MARDPDPDLSTLLRSIAGTFRVEPIELPECPIFVAVALPLGPFLTGRRPRLPAGRGLTSKQAMISAAAEAVELLSCLARNIAPESFRFERRCDVSYLCAQELASNADAWFPAQQIFLDFAEVSGEPLLWSADTTGNAAAATRRSAIARGILECIERDAVALWWYGRQRRDHLPPTILDPVEPRLSWWLAARERTTILIDITSDVGVPVVVAASAERNGSRIALGSAAAPTVVSAAVSAVTEMVQTETSFALGDTLQNLELAEWIASASTGMPQFQPADGACVPLHGTVEPLKALLEKDFKPCVVKLDKAGDLLACVKILVPGLSALQRRFDPARILKVNAANLRFDGVSAQHAFEILEPY